ncbi:MAG: hypothetical protein ACRDNT_31745 [Streptosporangiaceae bacterium]
MILRSRTASERDTIPAAARRLAATRRHARNSEDPPPSREAGRLSADQQELISRHQRQAANAPPGARTVVFAFLAYPEPAPDAGSSYSE